ncbi:MAG: fluoride efflux transporter CrcB [Pseudomonadota bacterium]
MLVMLGGAVGAGLRYVVTVLATRHFGDGFAVGTIAVNVVGSLAMGLVMAWLVARFALPGGLSDPGNSVRLLLATGILGGFTTFSAFALDAVVLWERGAVTLAAAYVMLSVGGSIAAVIAGLAIGRAIFNA